MKKQSQKGKKDPSKVTKKNTTKTSVDSPDKLLEKKSDAKKMSSRKVSSLVLSLNDLSEFDDALSKQSANNPVDTVINASINQLNNVNASKKMKSNTITSSEYSNLEFESSQKKKDLNEKDKKNLENLNETLESNINNSNSDSKSKYTDIDTSIKNSDIDNKLNNSNYDANMKNSNTNCNNSNDSIKNNNTNTTNNNTSTTIIDQIQLNSETNISKTDYDNKKRKSRFPIARIKRIMQSDDEIGKISTTAPVVLSRAIELFIADLIDCLIANISNKNLKIDFDAFLKVVENDKKFDFLKILLDNLNEEK
ncbi:hypothetical protein EDEG_02965 [Edhazardia aedis USNM 41457]|uniref:Transcription factor CBF/NF-Y/archaeal histone domain-containing protein n=1 Tax=Edhazardia aedis (strain USNM 41457) TaxID=1003232 RepID=J9DJ70_EDHAE|nr:hypothetical protein EDEG_02965 [Edhazardia aedis USNM 41457]|eukprot:EJW02645.1 hypothetical protein EDEG_02965 [Edhazardia aedis USNM 41457]